ncbi:MAG: hypothetical protein H6552_07230 [Chitinophagales bacterium]|nr:hypothetical protein [Chitinophagales bacterium]
MKGNTIYLKPLNESDNFVGVIYMQTNFSIKQIKKAFQIETPCEKYLF